MSTNGISRVQYFDKQFLRVDEFRDEQLYQLALRRRHNITQHSWGIVAGLELANEDGGATVVLPGIAIDGYGRELLLGTKVTLAPETFDDLATDRLDVWLVYDRKSDGSSPDGYGECGVEAGDGYRAAEAAKVLFERPLSNDVNARRPPGVPVEVLDAVVPPTSDDPAETWRVYLGRIIRLPDQIALDPNNRLYAGVVAETIDHPANAVRVDIGKRSDVSAERTVAGVTYSYEKGQSPSPRLAVFVPEDLAGGPTAANVSIAPRLEITAEGTNLRGRTIVNGNLQLAGGAVRFTDPADFTANGAPTEPCIYRFNDNGTDELRIDLGARDTANRQFVIGFSTSDGKFKECLRIEMQDTGPLVTISGDLNVEGKITADGGQAFPPLTTEAQAAILGSFLAGLAAGKSP